MGSKILIVDDAKINLLLLKRILEKYNYQIYMANDGEEAIDILKKELIQLVLLDIRMPKIDGFGVLKEKNKIETMKNVPVIMVSAYNEQETIDKSLESGAHDYLTKPINKTDLLHKMDNLLNNFS